MNFILLFNMMMWIPQDPLNTGALHAFLLNFDDIPITTRKSKHAMPIMAIKTLNAPCIKMSQQQSNNKQNDNCRKRSRSPQAQESNKSRRSRSPSRNRPPRAPSIPRVSPPRNRAPPAEGPDTKQLLEQILLSAQKP
jgi:hypothetical protein